MNRIIGKIVLYLFLNLTKGNNERQVVPNIIQIYKK